MKWLARVTCALTSSSVVSVESVVNNNTDKSNPGNGLVGRNRTARQEAAMYKKRTGSKNRRLHKPGGRAAEKQVEEQLMVPVHEQEIEAEAHLQYLTMHQVHRRFCCRSSSGLSTMTL